MVETTIELTQFALQVIAHPTQPEAVGKYLAPAHFCLCGTCFDLTPGPGEEAEFAFIIKREDADRAAKELKSRRVIVAIRTYRVIYELMADA